jgi:cell division septation protein DedD
MGNLSPSIGVQNRYPKARQFARSPVLFVSIQLGKNLQGFILNASEGGVCVQTAREIVGDEPLDIRFQSVRPGSWVNARGRIVWKNESNTVAGLQFIDADKEIAGEVRNWLNFGESLQELRGDWWPDSPPANPPVTLAPAMADTTPILLPRAPAPIEIPASTSAAATLPDYSSFETDEGPSPGESPQLTLVESDSRPNFSRAPEASDPGVIGFPSPQASSRRQSYDYIRPSSVKEEHRGKLVIAGIAAAVSVLLLVGWFVFGIKGRPAGATNVIAPTAVSSLQPGKPYVAKSAEPTAANHTASTPTASPTQSATQAALHQSIAKPGAPPASNTSATAVTASSGLVLQVAAMSEEANANRLAGSLKSGHFPAFVSKHNGDPFYRVIVGPFPAEGPLREAAANLKKSGYDSIEKHWSP